ncbi:MAG TPA: RNA methyltransferase [Methylobacterium sp.]|jgi:tRNA G18 (ribose-2'-O)-methylase SpoU|nr:RNA methyltransferase [Methylobacterium sp.]
MDLFSPRHCQWEDMPNNVTINDPADPRIEAYRDIRERDLVGREGMFVAEGKVVLEKLVASRSYRPVSLLIAAKRVDLLAPLLVQVPEDVPVFAAAQPVIDAIAGFPLHRGILAMGRRVASPTANDLLSGLPAEADVLLVSAIANHDNMGGIFRNAAAFGAKAILLDPDCCDPLYRKAIRVSVGAALLVPFARLPRGEDPIALLDRHGFTPIALSPAGVTPLDEYAPRPRNAVLLGAEGPGLSTELIDRSASVRIEMAAGFDSLNVATTSGIVLHHLSAERRRRLGPGRIDQSPGGPR